MMTTSFAKTVLLAAGIIAVGAFTVPQIASAATDAQAQTTEVKKDVKKPHKAHGKHRKAKKAGAAKRMEAPKTTQTNATPNN